MNGKTLIATALLALPTTATSAQTMPAPTYVMKAGAGDLYERQASGILLGSSNAKIRDFAQRMIHDHGESTAEVKSAAIQAHLKVAPPKLTQMQARDLAALRRVQGPARDALYIRQQKAVHQDALVLHSGYARDGRVAPLKMAASHIVPVVQHHIEMLDAM